MLDVLEWRTIGLDRGGRSIAVAGHPDRSRTYYFGATGGGLWKTTDGGTTWNPVTDGQLGSSSVGAVAVAPSNPDVVYIGMGEAQLRSNVIQGDGIYRSTDGGETWEKVLYQGPDAGAVDLALDPINPDVLYASFWEVYRKPWKLWSGGEGSGLYKPTDGGETWTELSNNDGFADGVLGKIGISVSRADPDRLYAVVEAEAGGLYRSDDGGST